MSALVALTLPLSSVSARPRFGQFRLHGRPDKQQQERSMRSARRAPIQ
jgi:hypothetical protein